MPGFYEEQIFPRMCDLLMRQFKDLRPRILEEATGRVLEIGHGTGLNLPHYGGGVGEIIAVEPSPGMNREAVRRREQAPFPVHIIQESAEKIPEPDESFDTVVSTFTFCTIPDAAAAAREAFRVLRPGGKFLFLEHVLDAHPKIAKWQHRINPLWRRAFCGCNLNRDTWATFESVGFNLSGARPINVEAPAIVRHLIVGTAIRP